MVVTTLVVRARMTLMEVTTEVVTTREEVRGSNDFSRSCEDDAHGSND